MALFADNDRPQAVQSFLARSDLRPNTEMNALRVILHGLDQAAGQQREFVLTPDHPCEPIKRASTTNKSAGKPTKDNLLFHSPIMSRQHATISLNLATRKLELEDDKSTHGTFIGTKKLLPNQKYELLKYDRISFGDKVREASKTHVPLEFKINYKWEVLPVQQQQQQQQQEAPLRRGFTVPEPEDDDSVFDDYDAEASVNLKRESADADKVKLKLEQDEEAEPVTALIPKQTVSRTFSVPSATEDSAQSESDSEEEEGNSEDSWNLQESSVITTPDSKASEKRHSLHEELVTDEEGPAEEDDASASEPDSEPVDEQLLAYDSASPELGSSDMASEADNDASELSPVEEIVKAHHGIKRKAADLFEDSDSPILKVASLAPSSANETDLPDAQAREADLSAPTDASMISQVDTTAPLADEEDSDASDAPASTDSEDDPDFEHRRKRAKLSSESTLGGIAKFVSGVCVGAVGVLATIIATAPADVREEAFREARGLI